MSLSSKRVGFFFAREKVHIIGHTQRIFFVKILTVLDEKRKLKKYISQTKNTGQIESNLYTLFLDPHRRRP